jgi:exopolyphosphatase/guanosine-5'-triphosphate,3'-diphosphate pyrophosphatase
MRNFAVIDLGTNTFHLLIAQVVENGFHKLHQERIYVQLGELGIETIGEVPFNRGVLAMRHFSEVLEQFKIEKVHAIGTAALRAASNSQVFVEEVKTVTGIDIQVVDGEVEAELIQRGVRLAVPILEKERVVIMDIGGGSVEFIIADAQQVYWAASFEIGVSVLWKKFHQSNPISATETADLLAFLDQQLISLRQALQQFPVTRLVGASGTFDVMAAYLPNIKKSNTYSISDLADFDVFKMRVLQSTEAELYQTPEIPRERVKYISVAFLLIQWVLNELSISELTTSYFAMKEGILSAMAHGEDAFIEGVVQK